MLFAAAVCPHPPLLVPEIASGAAADLSGLRAACDKALHRLEHVDVLVVVGSGPVTRSYTPGCAAGSLAGYGVDVRVGSGEPVLPLSLTVGLWLAERSAMPSEPYLQAVRHDTSAADCVRLGSDLARGGDRVGLLVMGDGSAKREARSPGYVDARATGFDAQVRHALETGDTRALLDLDPGLARELLAAGRAPWQVLAGAADGEPFTAELLFDEAPYGVYYLVASWLRS